MNMGFPDGMLALDRLAAGPVRWSGRLRADPANWDLGGVRLARDPGVELLIEASGQGGMRVRGRMLAEVEQECRRCLDPVVTEVAVKLDLRFDPSIGPDDETEGLYAADPEADELELLPALREELLLALPEFPVCREECLGLCPDCGGNRNEGDCGCRTESMDPRWEALKQGFPTKPDAPAGAGDGTDDD